MPRGTLWRTLAWKLALVVKGQADAALLDSYEAERQPVAQRLLRTTDRAFMLVVSNTWLAGLFRTKILARIAAFAMRRPGVQRRAFRTISQIGIRYRGSPLSQSLAEVREGAPRAGDRFPWVRLKLRDGGPIEDLFEKLDDTRFNLIVIGQPLPTTGAKEFDHLLRTHVIPNDPANEQELAHAQVAGPCFYLLRPDGHIGLAGARLDWTAVTRYLADRVGIGSQGLTGADPVASRGRGFDYRHA